MKVNNIYLPIFTAIALATICTTYAGDDMDDMAAISPSMPQSSVTASAPAALPQTTTAASNYKEQKRALRQQKRQMKQEKKQQKQLAKIERKQQRLEAKKQKLEAKKQKILAQPQNGASASPVS